jgi:ubiquinone/menaquinone biosynthesis C-methylase UbiE
MGMRRIHLQVVLFALSLAPVPAQEHDATIHHRFDDVDHWVKVFDDPARDAWQKPEKVVRFLHVGPGHAVADLGAGTGYFTVHLAKAVGPTGKVYAVDIEPALVDHLRDRASKAGLAQVVPVLAEPADPKLPAAGVDLVFICDTWHHIDDRIHYLDGLAPTLKPGGRVAIVAGHKLSRDAVVRELEGAGWKLAGEYGKLRYQYVLVFTPPRTR